MDGDFHGFPRRTLKQSVCRSRQSWEASERWLTRNNMKQLVKSFVENLPYIRGLHEKIRKQGANPAGHYYSPIPDRDEALEYLESRKPLSPELRDVRLNKERQFELLQEYAGFYEELPFSEKQQTGQRYFYDNGYFCHSDAIFLYSFLRKHAPKRIIEVGSGFSSAVMLDTINGFFPHRPDLTFIEPYPSRLEGVLRGDDKDWVKIIGKRVQEVPVEFFSSLEAGDLLFIDSSHVMKCGSDVQMLVFEILPLLPVGVFVHFHDIFYPFEYPREWLERGKYWNESYFLRAFLSYNCEWAVYFFNDYVALTFGDFIKDKMPLCVENSGGSLYLQRERRS